MQPDPNGIKPDPKTKGNWFYVVIQNPGSSQEELMGFEIDAIDKPFIPAFKSQEQAQQCFLLMPKDLMKNTYQVQAIIKDDLIEQANKSSYKVFLMDEKSSVQQELN